MDEELRRNTRRHNEEGGVRNPVYMVANSRRVDAKGGSERAGGFGSAAQLRSELQWAARRSRRRRRWRRRRQRRSFLQLQRSERWARLSDAGQILEPFIWLRHREYKCVAVFSISVLSWGVQTKVKDLLLLSCGEWMISLEATDVAVTHDRNDCCT